MYKDSSTHEPAAADIDIVLLQLPADLTLHDASHWSRHLDADDESRLAQLRTEQLRLRYTAGHGLLRSTLSRVEPAVEPAAWRFSKADKGKPMASADDCDRPPHFNLSYTSGLLACAVAREVPIGIDIERVDIAFPFSELTAKTLSVAESDLLRSLPEADRPSCFFEIWTLKEAYLKALGVGLEPDLTSLCFLPEEGLRIEIEDETAWQFELHSVGDDSRLALAYPGERRHPIHMRWIRFDGKPGEKIPDSAIARSQWSPGR